jgi:cytochrome c peroxidase
MSVAKSLGFPVAGLILVSSLCLPLQAASAQTPPSIIPTYEDLTDPSGKIGTYQPGGPTSTASNAFFQALGTNGRSCFTCHQPQNAWSVSAASVKARFTSTSGKDPIFALFDGATCPSDPVATLAEKKAAYELLTSRGLIRVGLPLPPNAQFEITNVQDPYNCSNNASIGMAGIYSFYRRPLPTTNTIFLVDYQWDGREPDLKSQAIMAALNHEQATAAPTDAQLKQIVAFESGIYTAQDYDANADALNALSATGGPQALATQRVLETDEPFDLYAPWANLTGTDPVTQARLSVARGEQVFNSNCSSCHNVDGAGDNFAGAFFNNGVANAGNKLLNLSGLPVFTVKCNLNGVSTQVTDLGRAMISGLCEDIGSFKVHSLRGLAARAPYFHNGGAATLEDAVHLESIASGLGLSKQQESDLVNFLKTL